MPQLEKGPSPAPGGLAPPGRISAPDYVDYHMILDAELDQLARPEAGVLGSFGFAGLGAAIGFVPSFTTVLSKLSAQTPQSIEPSDVATVAAICLSLALALICLILFAISKIRNIGLVKKIRTRKRRDLEILASV